MPPRELEVPRALGARLSDGEMCNRGRTPARRAAALVGAGGAVTEAELRRGFGADRPLLECDAPAHIAGPHFFLQNRAGPMFSPTLQRRWAVSCRYGSPA